jgi:hypothetical protein
MFAVNILFGQENTSTSDDWKKDRWSAQFFIGLNGFSTKGIPSSRNEINFNALHPDSASSYQQESRVAGICFQIGVQYQIMPNAKIGILLNAFKDDGEYLYTGNNSDNVSSIQADSMNRLTIRNLQSYVNLGVNYEHQVYTSKSQRHRFNAGLATGVSINRTPDRSEFDYLDENHFIAIDTVSNNVWRLTSTHFNSGFFLAPTISYDLCFKNNHCFKVAISNYFQWHSTEQKMKILDSNSDGSLSRKAYSLQALQIKFGYSF